MDCIYRLAKPAPTTATLRELETLQHVFFSFAFPFSRMAVQTNASSPLR